jgi:hypothetical protein
MRNFALSVRDDITKLATDDVAKRTAVALFKIINFLFGRVPQSQKKKFFSRLRGKIIRLSPGEIGSKKMPASSAIGQSISLSKNILAGLNPLLIRKILIELIHILNNAGIYYK